MCVCLHMLYVGAPHAHMHITNLLVDPLSQYILQKHVDVIKSFCSTVTTVSTASKGGRDKGELQETVSVCERYENRTSSRGLSNIIPSDTTNESEQAH